MTARKEQLPGKILRVAAALGEFGVLTHQTVTPTHADNAAVQNAVNNRTAVVQQIESLADLGIGVAQEGGVGPEPHIAGVFAAPEQQAPPYWSVDGGIFFPQEGSQDGFAVTDQMLGAYREMGGYEGWGKPLSRVYEDENGRVSQAFEGGMFQLAEDGNVEIVAIDSEYIIPQEALRMQRHVRGEVGQPGTVAEIPAGEQSVEKDPNYWPPEEIEIGPGSFIYNMAGDVGIGLSGLASEREENLAYIQSMFKKYGEGRKLQIFIRRDVPAHIPQGVESEYLPVMRHGAIVNGVMEIHLVLKPEFNKLDDQSKFDLGEKWVGSDIWAFLAGYKFLPREQFEGYLLRRDPPGIIIFDLLNHPQMMRDLGELRRFATYF